MISPVKLHLVLQRIFRVGATRTSLIYLNCTSIENLVAKHKGTFAVIADIKRCNEVVFSKNTIEVFEHYGILSKKMIRVTLKILL